MDEFEVPENHAVRQQDRYGPGNRFIRQWSLDTDGVPVCASNAIDTQTASAEEITAALAANAAIRAGLGVNEPALLEEPPAALPSPREFMDRLSMTRQAEITAAATQSPQLLLWLLRMTGAREVDPAHPETVAGVQALQAAGVISAEEVAALLV